MAKRAGHPKHGTHSHASCDARRHAGTRTVTRASRLRAPAGTVSTNDTAEDCHNTATSVLQFRKDQARPDLLTDLSQAHVKRAGGAQVSDDGGDLACSSEWCRRCRSAESRVNSL